MGSPALLRPQSIIQSTDELELSYPQYVFLKELDTKFKAYVGGFGSGKTYVGCLDLGLFALENPRLPQGYFGPSYPSIRDIFYPTMEEACFSLGMTIDVKEGNKEVHLYRGSNYKGVVICRSMDRPGSIIGFKIARALVDEIDTLSFLKAQNAWRKIIARLRYMIKGVVNGISVTTTPEGFLFAYQTFGNEPTESYSMVQASTYENEKYLPDDYIASLRESYTEELIEAYILGKFCNLKSGTVYRQFDRSRNNSKEEIQPSDTLHIGMDFNIGKMSAKVHVQRENGWHQVAELDEVFDTHAMITKIEERWRQPERSHGIVIYPDASGKKRSTSSKSANATDLNLLRLAGFTVKARDSNPRVRDRYNSLNNVFEKKKLFINTKACPISTQALEQQAFDLTGDPDKEGGFDHSNDATGYFNYWHNPITFRKSTNITTPQGSLNYWNR